jgi:hypothetical protein
VYPESTNIKIPVKRSISQILAQSRKIWPRIILGRCGSPTNEYCPIALELFAGRRGMFNSGDTVEELSTGRRGLVALSGVVGIPPNRWTVQFSDGRQPLLKNFTDPSELRLVKAVAEAGAPGLVPERWVV